MRGLSEHHLPQGNAHADLVSADKLFEQCKADPEFSNSPDITKGCANQEDANMRALADWFGE